jgi:putative ABC transport system substrate-binding protein
VIDRRAFLAGMGAVLLTAPLAARGQQPDKIARLGVINSGVNLRSASFFQAFEQRLRDLGWVDGKNLRIEFQVPKDPSDFAAIGAEFVRLNVDVILAGADLSWLVGIVVAGGLYLALGRRTTPFAVPGALRRGR